MISPIYEKHGASSLVAVSPNGYVQVRMDDLIKMNLLSLEQSYGSPEGPASCPL